MYEKNYFRRWVVNKIPTDEVGILYVDRDAMNRISTEVKRLFAVVQFLVVLMLKVLYVYNS